MNLFTISELQRFSGINVHSIRAWEKRYDALQPERSEGNTRYYNGNQLRRLLNISSLMNSDYKISELCSMSDNQLQELISINLEKEISNAYHDEFLLSQLVSSALTFNEFLFDKVFSRLLLTYGMENGYLKVIYPALRRLGIMWSADILAPAQEHFISNLIRQKFNTAIDILPINERSKNHWLLFLPENESHESGLLMSNYLIRNAGHHSTYLGANVPFVSLIDTVKIIKPTSLLFFLVAGNDADADKDFIKKMQKQFPSQKIFVAADVDRLTKIKPSKNLILLNSLEELKINVATLSK